MSKLTDRIETLSKYATPEGCAWSDRSRNGISYLVDYMFEREGGGRRLVYSKWNRNLIESMSEDDFDKLIEELSFEKKMYEAFSKINIFELLDGKYNEDTNE